MDNEYFIWLAGEPGPEYDDPWQQEFFYEELLKKTGGYPEDATSSRRHQMADDRDRS